MIEASGAARSITMRHQHDELALRIALAVAFVFFTVAALVSFFYHIGSVPFTGACGIVGVQFALFITLAISYCRAPKRADTIQDKAYPLLLDVPIPEVVDKTSELGQACKLLKEVSQIPPQQLLSLRRSVYRHFDKAYENSEEPLKLQEIAFSLITKVQPLGYGRNLLFNRIKVPLEPCGNLVETLKRDRGVILRTPRTIRGGFFFEKLNKLKGAIGLDFNPLESNNFASKLFEVTYPGGRATVLRMPTPTEENLSKPRVLPIFRAFLDYCKHGNLRVLSFQHQNPDNRLENARLEAVCALEKEFQGTFYTFRQPMDGPLFDPTQICNAVAFKETFLKTLAKKELLDTIHDLYFKNAPTLDAKMQRQFQLIAYVYFQEHKLMELQGNFLYSQCKDTIDRSMVLQVLSYYIKLMRQGKEKDVDMLLNLRTLAAMLPLLVKGTGMDLKRFNHLIEALDLLERLTPEQKERVQAENPAVSFDCF